MTAGPDTRDTNPEPVRAGLPDDGAYHYYAASLPAEGRWTMVDERPTSEVAKRAFAAKLALSAYFLGPDGPTQLAVVDVDIEEGGLEVEAMTDCVELSLLPHSRRPIPVGSPIGGPRWDREGLLAIEPTDA